MASKAGPFTFTELQTVTSLSRGEIRECVKRGIITAPTGVGRAVTGCFKMEFGGRCDRGSIAAAGPSRGAADVMMRLRLALMLYQIDPQAYCAAPLTHDTTASLFTSECSLGTLTAHCNPTLAHRKQLDKADEA